MELPPALRAAVERTLEGVPLADLRQAAETLSSRYRAEVRDGRAHVGDALAAQAYLATRLPATYAAVRAAFEATVEVMPDFAPRRLFDAGAGPGTALWAATDCWPGLEDAVLVEASAAMRAAGERLASAAGVGRIEWRAADLNVDAFGDGSADLVTLAYVLDEMSPDAGLSLVSRLWDATAGLLVVVEPGTPAGWRRILAARTALIERGARIVAPCPHAAACPVAAPDWCHFARRVARSRLHRQAKRGEVPFEDEKFVYLAAARRGGEPVEARVLAPPLAASGQVALKLCLADGGLEQRRVTRRDGEAFRSARRVSWGEAL